jgi:ATP-dependent RNA helicase DDX55/SPB4
MIFFTLQVLAMIISPTRELALQTHEVAAPFFQSCASHCSLVPLIGGTDITVDVSLVKTKGAAALVGTPGRISDVINRCPALSFKNFEVLVLDEADRLLEMGFQAQMDAIMSKLPRQRRTGLFSATQTVRSLPLPCTYSAR